MKVAKISMNSVWLALSSCVVCVACTPICKQKENSGKIMLTYFKDTLQKWYS